MAIWFWDILQILRGIEPRNTLSDKIVEVFIFSQNFVQSYLIMSKFLNRYDAQVIYN